MNRESVIEHLKKLSLPQLPAAIIDLDAFDRNLEQIAQIVSHSPTRRTVRIASKSVRVPALLKRTLRRGPPIQGLMTYSAEETAWLSDLGFDDFLLAYPTVQRSDLQAIEEVIRPGKTLRIVVDCNEHLSPLIALGQKLRSPIRVMIDMDASLKVFGLHLGVQRSPVRSVEDFKALLKKIKSHPELQFDGILSYEAQVAGLTDQNPFTKFLNPIAKWIRATSMKKLKKERKLLSEISEPALFNAGGTGSLNWTAKEPWINELTAGSALYSPHLFDYYSNIRFEPSCYFALQAVRTPTAEIATCQGGGYIASGRSGKDRLPLPVQAGALLTPDEGAGEVQTPVKDLGPIQIGDPVFFRHAKAGELMEHFNEVHLVSQGKIIGSEKTYRGEGKCFF